RLLLPPLTGGKVQGFLAETPKILAPNNRKSAPKQSFYALFRLLSRHYFGRKMRLPSDFLSEKQGK
ncbi:MAG: hypothetical protein SOU50_05300, partial [Oscillospiraceae bacterium]|nr:hypothetical protein [Oscillospiraceae bacterium]